MKDLEVLEHMKEHYKNQLEGAERQQAQANKRCKEQLEYSHKSHGEA